MFYTRAHFNFSNKTKICAAKKVYSKQEVSITEAVFKIRILYRDCHFMLEIIPHRFLLNCPHA